MNGADIFLTICVVAAVLCALWVLRRTNKSGKRSCGCDKDEGCSGNCARCGKCSSR